jgi:putative transposase
MLRLKIQPPTRPSRIISGQNVGIKQVSERVWLVTFIDYDLGYFDDETGRLEPVENPFGPKLLPYPCRRYET